MNSVAERLESVRTRIADACRAVGRDPRSVTLVAVSKRVPTSAMREAYAAGQRIFGENYVQELVAKRSELADLADLRLHLIGHLQTNKAKAVAANADAVHTVDSARVAEALARARSAADPLDVFVQVNVSGESSKSGCRVDDVDGVVAACRAWPSLRLRGLMTVPPPGDEDATRAAFSALAALGHAHGLEALSMGMSADLELAVAAGATHVRVGTALFGERAVAVRG